MLNMLMSQSPRYAAMLTNKPYGEEAITKPAIQHRLAWLRRERGTETTSNERAPESGLRERTA